MPVYNYRALKDDGGADAGVIDADSPKDARLKLKNRRLHVTDLQTVSSSTDETPTGARSSVRVCGAAYPRNRSSAKSSG